MLLKTGQLALYTAELWNSLLLIYISQCIQGKGFSVENV